MPRTIKSGLEGHWSRVLDDFADSNCSVSQYCQQLNISKASLYGWSKRLGVPLKARNHVEEALIEQKEATPLNTDEATPFSFVELNIPVPNSKMVAPLPVKFELLLAQGRSLKIEAPSTWDGIIGLTKTLVG